MLTPRAINHIGMTVPDIDRAIEWYGNVVGFRMIFRRTLEFRPEVPEVRDIFGPRFAKAYQAHLVSSAGIGLELFQFIEPPVTVPNQNFQYWQSGVFHLCVTDPDLEGFVARVLANNGKQRTSILTFLPDRPYQLVYCEDIFGNVVEAFSHPYSETFAPIGSQPVYTGAREAPI